MSKIAEDIFRRNFVPNYKEDVQIKEMTPYEQGLYKQICIIVAQATADIQGLIPSEREIERIIFKRVQYHYQETNEDYMIGSPNKLAQAIHSLILDKMGVMK